jgi:hypothetical protein
LLSRTQQQAGIEMTQQLSEPTFTFDLEVQKEKENFEKILTESIDEVFTTLGKNVKQAIYSYLEKAGIRKEQISSKIEVFTDAIESIFGNAAILIELKIIERLQHKANGFEYKSKMQGLIFADYLAALQIHLNWASS